MSKQKSDESPTLNEGFGVVLPDSMNTDLAPKPPAPAVEAKPVESPEARLTRLRALAQVEIDRQTDAEAVAKMVADARTARDEALLPKDTSGWPAEYLKVNIYKGHEKHDLAYVPLGLDGYVIKAPRGRDIILPKVFVDECLDHAIEEITVQSQGGLITQPRHRFPYQIIGKATAEEYQAFQVEERGQYARDMKIAERMSA